MHGLRTFRLTFSSLLVLTLVSASAVCEPAKQQAWLGVIFSPSNREVESTLGRPGAVVRRAIEGGPAHKAGLREGDLIYKVNDEPIADFRDINIMKLTWEPGQKLRVNVLRRGNVMRFDVILEKFTKAHLAKVSDVWKEIELTETPPISVSTSTEYGLRRYLLSNHLSDEEAKSLILDLVTRYPWSRSVHPVLAHSIMRKIMSMDLGDNIIGRLRDFISSEPKNVGALHNLGFVLWHTGHARNSGAMIQEAVRVSEDAVRYDPDSLEDKKWLAAIYSQEGRLEAAKGLYEQILVEFPNSNYATTSHLNIAEIHYKLGNYKQASYHCNEVLKLKDRSWRTSSTPASAYNILGLIALQEGRIGHAEEYLLVLTRSRPPPLLDALVPLVELSQAMIERGYSESAKKFLAVVEKFASVSTSSQQKFSKLRKKLTTKKGQGRRSP